MRHLKLFRTTGNWLYVTYVAIVPPVETKRQMAWIYLKLGTKLMWHRAGSLKWTMWVTDLLPDEKDFVQEKKGCQWSPDAGDWENSLLLPESAPPSAVPVIKTFNYSLCAKQLWNRYGFHRGTKGVSNVPIGPVRNSLATGCWYNCYLPDYFTSQILGIALLKCQWGRERNFKGF